MTARPLKAKLENACKDLWWSSEADYPVEVVWCEIPESQCPESGVLAPALVRQVVGCAEDAAVTSQLFDSLFDKYLMPKRWHTAEDKQQLNQLRALKTLLSENISNLQVYRCGEVEITLCILGYVSIGILAGVKTYLVET